MDGFFNSLKQGGMNMKTEPIPPGLKGVLFDLDGTVLDSMPWHIKAWQEVFAPAWN